MPDRNKKFHEFAIQSLLFKGRADWYFCFLKAEKIAHVLAVMVSTAPSGAREKLDELSHMAAHIPQEVAHFAAGEAELSFVLADIFSLMSSIRLCVGSGALSKESASLLCYEYEQMAERIQGGGRMSPFISGDDFSVPEVSTGSDTGTFQALSLSHMSDKLDMPLKGISKGHLSTGGTISARGNDILSLIKKKGDASIRDIAAVIKDCSEKTIQRELNALIERGLLRREGERRWSRYIYIV